MSDEAGNKLTHIDDQGRARMVDVGSKDITERVAIASARVAMQPATLALIQRGDAKKGDVLAVARIAGIQAAKKCSDLIPLCHPLALTSVEVTFEIDETASEVLVFATCKVVAKTGVEMEALTAASVAALTIYDMCKAVDRGMQIREVGLEQKSGGKSGDWVLVMSIRVVLFASLREELGSNQVDVELPAGGRISDLISQLAQTQKDGDAWQEKLTAENVRVAVNQELIAGNETVADGDEVAFFPPVTGG